MLRQRGGLRGLGADKRSGLPIEGYVAFRRHKRVERNLVLAAKLRRIHGFVCQACGFDFSEMYTGIPNRKCIEAHHLIPISMLEGQRVTRNPRTDFAMLCASCHRVIHRFESPWDLEVFRKAIKGGGPSRPT